MYIYLLLIRYIQPIEKGNNYDFTALKNDKQDYHIPKGATPIVVSFISAVDDNSIPYLRLYARWSPFRAFVIETELP